MLALAMIAAVPVVLWTWQLAARLWYGAGANPAVVERIRRGSRVAVVVTLLAVMVAYPLARGVWPSRYFADLFPADRAGHDLLWGLAASVLYLAGLYLAWSLTDNVRFRRRLGWGETLRHVMLVPASALLGAGLEECLFRGVVLADLLRWLAPPAGVVLSAVVFAAAHYVRNVKRYWTFPGHLAIGMLLGFAFVRTGALWLPLGLHAGGMATIMLARVFVTYTGQEWLVGASVFPYAGVVGIVAVALLTVNVILTFGGLAG